MKGNLTTPKKGASVLYDSSQGDSAIGNLGMSGMNWANVQKLVRAGLAPQVFSVGDQLICNHTSYGEMVWDIIDFDHDVPTDTAYTHSMSLQLHNAGQSLQFDAREALYYAENGLAAGTYHFTVPAGYDATHGGDGKSYQFTLTKAVPAGGHIEFGWAFNKDASTARLYTVESPSVVTAIENVAVSEGSGGTALTVLNNFDPARFGSERWGQSCARQWLNADGAAGAWWTAQHDYDRPYSADLTNKAGFLNGMDADFLAVIGTVTKRTALCEKIYGKNTYEDLPERFFLPSCSEVYSVISTAFDEGAPYAYYLDNSTLSAPGAGADANRMKYKNDGTAAYWWLRTPRRDNQSFPHLVMPNGSVINGAFAYNSQHIMPVCNVI